MLFEGYVVDYETNEPLNYFFYSYYKVVRLNETL